MGTAGKSLSPSAEVATSCVRLLREPIDLFSQEGNPRLDNVAITRSHHHPVGITHAACEVAAPYQKTLRV